MFRFMVVLKYKLKILFSDKSFLIAMTIIPLFLTLITGYALKFEKYDEIPVAICDLDNTDYSSMILDRIEGKQGFKIIRADEDKTIKLIKDYKAESAFIIKEGFKESILLGNIKGIIEQIAYPSSTSQEIIREIIGSEVARIILNAEAADWVVNEYEKLNRLLLSPESDFENDVETSIEASVNIEIDDSIGTSIGMDADIDTNTSINTSIGTGTDANNGIVTSIYTDNIFSDKAKATTDLRIAANPSITIEPSIAKIVYYDKKVLWAEVWDFTDSLWEPEPPMKLVFEEIIRDGADIHFDKDTENREVEERVLQQDSSITLASYGMLIAFIMFLIIFNSGWLVEERDNGTLARIISGPGALTALFAGNILSLLVIGILQILLFSTICSFFFKVHILSGISSIVIILIYLCSVIGVSLFISSILKTKIQLQAGAPLFSIITAFVGGCFWNLTEVGGIVKAVSLLTPQGLALDLFLRYSRTIPGRSTGNVVLSIISSPLGAILLFIAFGLTAISYIRTRNIKYS